MRAKMVWSIAAAMLILVFALFGIPCIAMLSHRSNGIIGAALLVITVVGMAAALVAFHPEIGLWSDDKQNRT